MKRNFIKCILFWYYLKNRGEIFLEFKKLFYNHRKEQLMTQKITNLLNVEENPDDCIKNVSHQKKSKAVSSVTHTLGKVFGYVKM